MILTDQTRPRVRACLLIGVSVFVVVVLVGAYFLFRGGGLSLDPERRGRVVQWIRNPDAHSEWAVTAGERCGEAPFILPTSGFIGFLWDDSFRPGHRHQGLDIFGGAGENIIPVITAYPGYLWRLEDWKASVIIRIPDDPLNPGRQIWTYYTHMANSHGSSFIAEDFPPGSREVYVEAGTLLGYQGNYSGTPGNPTGVHLHFSIVRDGSTSIDPGATFRNELEIENTLDPSPYFGMLLNAHTAGDTIPVCGGQE